MKDVPFVFHMDLRTAENLKRLAEETERSKAGVLRWLINVTAERRELLDATMTTHPCLADRVPEGDKP
jgi:predicted DNA-binding protein